MAVSNTLKHLFSSRRALDIGQWGFAANLRGHLQIDECDTLDLANQYGTPLHVVSATKLIQNCQNAKRTLTAAIDNIEIFYSYKTNPVPGIIEIIHGQGIGAEVISAYELWMALKLGIPGEQIVFNGPHKSKESLETAVTHGVKLINLDSLADLHKVLAVCKSAQFTANLGLRLSPSRGWQAQFGFSMTNGEALEAFRILAQNKHLATLKGLHVHIGTQMTNHSIFSQVMREVADFVSDLDGDAAQPIEFLDIGGGIGVPTVREIDGIERKLCDLLGLALAAPNPNQSGDLAEFGKIITQSVEYYVRKCGGQRPVVIIEPGRLITSNAQILLLGVKAIKRRNTPAVILDGGKVNITYPASFEYHEVFVANKISKKPSQQYDLFGRTCTPSDKIYGLKTLPALELGDCIAIMDAGAYFTGFTTSFAFPRPEIILVEGGQSKIVRKRETFDQMVSLDQF